MTQWFIEQSIVPAPGFWSTFLQMAMITDYIVGLSHRIVLLRTIVPWTKTPNYYHNFLYTGSVCCEYVWI